VDVIPGARYARPHWTPDSGALVYEWLPTDSRIPVAERPGYTELRLHLLGTPPTEDRLLHPRTGDPTRFLGGSLSRDGQYLFVYQWRGWGETDVFWQRFGQEQGFRRLARGIYPDSEAHRRATYSVVAWKDRFYLLTNEGASRRRVLTVDPRALDEVPEESDAGLQAQAARWQELVPEDAEGTLESLSIVGGHLALDYLKRAASELRVHTLRGAWVHTLPLPTVGTASALSGDEEEEDAYFSFSSYTLPLQVYRAHVSTGQVQVWARAEVDIRPEDFCVRQELFTSRDGTRVTMFLVHRKGLVRDGSHPTLLYGYGGFDISLTPGFRGTLLPWLEAGGLYAVANLRGGGELGKAWHDAGRLEKKQNVFEDFLAAAEHLVREGYTQPARLACEGGSNGGLLVGAAMVQRPDLFGAVVCAVPLLDMVRYHLFGSGRTWVPEYGCAEREEDFRYLYAYSPYHRVRPGTAYPALLMMAAQHDDRVDPLHARKFMAALQNATASAAPVLLRVEQSAGHGGADRVRQTVEAAADKYGFLMGLFRMEAPAAWAPSRGGRAD
jgi:prolyl oligopeptidase